MKILRVELSNLNSLRGTFTIDFTDEAFTSSGIFAITGPTGAGKSTILDAICLALYSKTPRLNDIGSSNEIMTRSEGTCMAKVIFETANKHYLASFEQHRSRNKMDGALQNKTHLLIELDKDLQGGKSIASGRSVPNIVSEITGLDFDKFTKSMLLAQGNFANFLKSNDNERSELLEKLTGTAIYSRISQFVYQKDKEAKLLLESLKGALEQIDILSDGDLKEKEDAVKAIVEKIKVLENENQHLNTVLNKFTEFNKAKKSAQDLHHEQQTLTAKFEEFKPKERKIYKAKKANLIKNDYFNLKDKEKNLQELNNEIELLTTSLTLLKSDKDTLETNLKNKNETFLKHKEKIAAFKKISDKVIELDAKIALESNALRQLKLSKEDLQEKENLCKKNLANNKKSLLNLQNKQ
ncbi:AAA family ATPase, partial [Succinatimonas hippei]|uniref:AAA family ATPase n=1 Tax=Succinatimonas hippei TaxID=626938 RepID=UPI0024917240